VEAGKFGDSAHEDSVAAMAQSIPAWQIETR
jgi:hypothetical protein